MVRQVGNVITPPLRGCKFESSLSIEQLDERMSLEIWSSIPVANRISAVNDEETVEHLMASFDLSALKQFKVGRTDIYNTIQENTEIGMEDLTRGNQEAETINLMPGVIQHVNTRITTKYFDKNAKKVQRVPTDFTDGSWFLTLLFNKNV